MVYNTVKICGFHTKEKRNMAHRLTEDTIAGYQGYMAGEEYAPDTIKKYLRDIRAFAAWVSGQEPRPLAGGTGHSFREAAAGDSKEAGALTGMPGRGLRWTGKRQQAGRPIWWRKATPLSASTPCFRP